jgi:hypothetical protein
MFQRRKDPMSHVKQSESANQKEANMNEQNQQAQGTVNSDQSPKREWHRRHHDWEVFDHIELKVVPRYKTSGLSGDEWRVSVQARFFFKGLVVHETHFHDMRSALAMLPHEVAVATCPIPQKVIELEKTTCDQVGCHREAVSKYRLKRLTSEHGEYLHESEGAYANYVRRFCKRHLRRGDCGREDADDNYEVIEGPGPDDSSNPEESPSEFGGVVQVDGIE